MSLKKTISSIDEPGKAIGSLYKKIPKRVRLAMVVSLAFSVITHFFYISNHLINHDAISQLFSDNDVYVLGRWSLKYASMFSSSYDLTVVTMIVAILAIAITTGLTVTVLDIKKKVSIFLVAGLLAVFPTITAINLYRYTTDAYMISFLLSTLAVYLTKYKKYGFLLGGVLLGLAAGMYQAYLFYAVSLVWLVVVLDLLRNKVNVREIVTEAFKFFGMLVIGVAVYYVGMKLSLFIHEASLISYQGTIEMGVLNFGDLSTLAKKAYLDLLRFYFGDLFLINGALIQGVYFFTFLISFLVAVFQIVKGKVYIDRIRLLMIVVLVLLAPIFVNSIAFAGGARVHLLMVMSYVHVLILAVCLMDMTIENGEDPKGGDSFTGLGAKLGVYLLFFLTVFSIYNFYIIDNKIYLKAHAMYENTYAFANRLAFRLESFEDFSIDKGVAIIGLLPNKNYPTTKKEFRELRKITGLSPVDYVGAKPKHVGRFVNDWIGLRILRAGEKQADTISKTKEFQDMPVYPKEGSIRLIDDVVVVKINQD